MSKLRALFPLRLIQSLLTYNLRLYNRRVRQTSRIKAWPVLAVQWNLSMKTSKRWIEVSSNSRHSSGSSYFLLRIAHKMAEPSSWARHLALYNILTLKSNKMCNRNKKAKWEPPHYQFKKQKMRQAVKEDSWWRIGIKLSSFRRKKYLTLNRMEGHLKSCYSHLMTQQLCLLLEITRHKKYQIKCT
jgi:hypothetical protein